MFKNIKILRPILVILILFIPLYPKFPLASVEDTYVAIRLDDIIIALSILIWIIFQIKNKFPVFRIKITKLFILYFLAISASLITAFFIYKTTLPNILLLNFLRRFEYMSLFFITISTIKNKDDLKLPFVSLVIATIFVCLYGYGQKYFSFPIISTMNEEFSKGQALEMNIWTRINSTFAGHYDLAVFLSVVLVILGTVIILSKNKIFKIFGLIIWLASFQIFTFTASRISTFAFWGGICFVLLLVKKYLWIIPISVLVVFSIFNSKDLKQRLIATIPLIEKQFPFFQPTPTLIPTPSPIPSLAPSPITKIKKIKPTPTVKVITPIITPIPTVIRNQIEKEDFTVDIDTGVARSGEIRFNVEWPRAINAFKKNILTGTGLGSITLATDNDFLRLLGESGILGFISFMAILFYFIIKTLPLIFKKNKNNLDNLNLIFLGSLLTFLANAIFIDAFEASKTAYLFWIMMGVYYQSLEMNKK